MAQTVKLLSSDETSFEVEREIAEMSVTIRNMLEDIPETDTAIPLPNVTGKIMQKVIEYCRYHKEHPSQGGDENRKDDKRTDDIIPWDVEFCKVDQATLFELILAANYLDIKPLLDLTCKTVANMIKGKTPEEIRKTFNIKNDFTPEEEEQVRRELLINEMLGFLINVQSGKASDPKLVIWSSHDTSLMSFLNAFQVWDNEWTPYASTINLELYEQSSTASGWAIRLVYNGKVLYIPGCPSTSELCDYDTFIGIAQKLVPSEAQCQYRPPVTPQPKQHF